MKLDDLVYRKAPQPWSEGGKIPWEDPAFSARMLREHLSQDHDRASRRSERIQRQVRWIHDAVLGGRQGRVLDLGCGPGFYTSALADLGHTCIGIDFSPASVHYARSEAQRRNLACEYHLRDMRDGSFGEGFDLALLIYGELNTFHPDDASAILREAHRALIPGGALLLEVHEERLVRELGNGKPTWCALDEGLFSDGPHVYLRECFWNEEDRVAIERYFVIDAGTSNVTVYHSTTQAYSEEGYDSLLSETGYTRLRRCPSLEGPESKHREGLFVLRARAGPEG